VPNIALRQWVLAALFLLMPWVADAAGLGRLIVLSPLGQPLHAEIDLVSVRTEELSTLSVRLASSDMYKQANLQYGSGLIGLRLSIEKRAGGQAYVKLATTRPIQEPFIDLLIELNWASGRITREYTALLDPPGFGSAVAELAPPVTAMARPAPAPAATAAPSAPVAPVTVAPAAGAKEYGPIKRGETLGKIANSLKPEGVTLEQMLVGLHRSNPDAFINNNLNLVKSGRILRVPEREALSAVSQQEALKEYRTQVADWNAYRRRLADAASTAPESGAAVSGKITPRVEDKAAGTEAKDVVVLSKGEPPGATAGKGKTAGVERVRALEEELVAREKALKEAGERIAQLEKTISDQQRLMELKSAGMAAAQQQAKAASNTDDAKPETAPKPAVSTADAKKEEPQAVAVAEKAAVEVKPEQPKAAPAPKPQPKAKAPPPPPEPDLIDTLLGEPLYLALGGGAILLAGLGFWMNRRRRSAPADGTGTAEKSDPVVGDAGAAPVAAATATVAATTAASASYDVDPLAEAEVYIAYGRDGQAEEILKEALDKNPDHEKAQLKLLEIYAARKDKDAFNKHSAGFNKLTGGQGENWQKVVAMGYALDPENPFYAAGKDLPVAADLEFDLGETGTTTDILLDAAAAQQATGETTEVMNPGAMQAMAGAADHASGDPHADPSTDIELDFPAAGKVTETDISLDADKPAESNVIDFNIELPEMDKAPAAPPKQTAAQSEEEPLDFKIDLPDVNLDLDDNAQAGAQAGGGKDAHWHDVQTKFDLAKAYQEMGENSDAKAILQEVIKEGDDKQQAEAKELLKKLG
jgi:pilus assembly protein FimV